MSNDTALAWLEEAATWANYLALLAKDEGGVLTTTTCVRLARILNEARPPAELESKSG